MLDTIFVWIAHYKYLVIFPVAVVEGPIIIIITGFLASLGELNFWVAFGVVSLADLIGDTLYYFIGRFGREKFIGRFGKYFGLTMERVNQMQYYFQAHPWKTFSFGKIAHGTGSLILTAAGLAKVPYWEFLGYNIPSTVSKAFILMVIGFYFGQAYASIDKYFNYIGLIIGAVLILVYAYFLYFSRKNPPKE